MAAPLKVVNDGKKKGLDLIRADALAAPWQMLLYTNNYTVVDTTVLGDLTEAAWVGYARQNLVGFPAASISGTHATTVGTDVTFSNTSGGSQTVYGRGIVDGVGNLYAASLFPGPITIPDGGTLVITPSLSDTTEF